MRLHWILALLLSIMLVLGLYMGSLVRTDPLKPWLLNWHLAIGASVFVLSLWRLGLRLGDRSADHRYRALPVLEQGLIRLVHVGFYGLMLGLPVAGFGIWLLDPFVAGPGLAGQSVERLELVGRLHRVHYLGAWLLVGLLIVHLGGVLRHHWDDRHGLGLAAMLPRRDA